MDDENVMEYDVISEGVAEVLHAKEISRRESQALVQYPDGNFREALGSYNRAHKISMNLNGISKTSHLRSHRPLPAAFCKGGVDASDAEGGAPVARRFVLRAFRFRNPARGTCSTLESGACTRLS